MHIVLVSWKFTRGDGQGRVNLEVAREALRRGWQVTLLANNVGDELLSLPGLRWIRINVDRVPTTLAREIVFATRSALRLWRLRARADALLVNGFITWSAADVTAAHFVHAAWWASPYRERARVKGPRDLYHWLYSMANAWLERAAYRRSRVVVAVSGQVRQQLIDRGIDPAAIQVIANGVDTAEFHPATESRGAARLPTGVVCGLFVGDLETGRKNLHTVLRALVACPQVHLAVVGTVGQSRYPAMAAELGLGERVHFLGYRRDVPQLMREADFVVYPSLYEPSGLVLLEAMASGVPVITARTVGGVEFAGEDCALVLEDPEDAAAMAEAVRQLVAEPSERARRVALGRQRAEQLQFAQMGARYCDLLAAIARRPS